MILIRDPRYIVVVLRFDEKLPSNPDDGLFVEASLLTSASRAHLLNPALILLPFCHPLSVCLLCESYHNATKPQALCQDISGGLLHHATIYFPCNTQTLDNARKANTTKIRKKKKKKRNGSKEVRRDWLFFFFFVAVVFSKLCFLTKKVSSFWLWA